MVIIPGVQELEEKVNRRNFLKSLGIACGAAVVAPATLLKPKCKHDCRWFAVKNSDAPIWCSFLNYDKHHHYEYTCILCGFTEQILFPPPTASVVMFRGVPVIYEPQLITGAHDETIQTTK